jgi:hypothetical protein
MAKQNLIFDIFNDDAFTAVNLTAAINNIDHVPDEAGKAVFDRLPIAEKHGVSTTAVSLESHDSHIELIATSERGAPTEQEVMDKRKLIGLEIPQIKLEQTIGADQVQNVRQFGASAFDAGLPDGITPVMSAMRKMVRRHDLTLENHRLGAIKGEITDADGTALLNLFETFGHLNSDGQYAAETINFDLENYSTPGFNEEVRVKCQRVTRAMARRSKLLIPPGPNVWAFCGDDFFDKLVSHPQISRAYAGTRAAVQALSDNFAWRVFEFGGIFFENYHGTDDEATVAIESDECRIFYTGDVRGIWGEFYAPADFLDTVNQVGLPRYARLALDMELGQWVKLHTQQNPLPICLRPQTLMRGIASEDSE